MAASNGRGDKIVNVSIAISIIITFAVILRFIARKKTKATLAADDWFILASLVPAYAMLVIASIFIKKGGAGRHNEELGRSQLTLLLRLLMPAVVTHGLTVTCVKISILLLYRRIFVNVAFGRLIVVVGTLCIVWLFANIFGQVFLCSPMSAAWDPSLIFSDKCRDVRAMFYGVSISNMLLDLIILCMPLPLIWGLPLSRWKKFGLCGIFSLGGLTCIASVLRITSIGDMKHDDFPYTILMTYFWSYLEPSIAICTACLMTYRPLFCLSTCNQSDTTPSFDNRQIDAGGGFINDVIWPLPPPIRSRLQLDPRSNLPGVDLELELLTKKEDQEKLRKAQRERKAQAQAQAYRHDHGISRIDEWEEASFV